MPSPVPAPGREGCEGAGSNRLRAALDEASDACGACAAAADFIVSLGPYMPSIYLERGRRLRCHASRGYWQVLDGFPEVSGVIARTYRTGEPVFIPDVETEPDYLAAVPGVRSEAAFPIRVEGVVAGALNVEATVTIPPTAVPMLETVANALGARLEQLGGAPEESRWQLLSRISAKRAGLTERSEIAAGALEALDALSDMDSALIALVGNDGMFGAEAARGPLGPALLQLEPESLGTIASWVNGASSCYSLGEPEGHGFTGQDSLRARGVQSVVVLGLQARGQTVGFLLAADRTSALPPTEEVELLELLATLTATSLQTAYAFEELRRRAALDPLTGLGHHGSFGHALEAIASSKESPSKVAVLVADVDGFKSVNDTLGHLAGDRVLVEMAARMARALRAGDRLYRIGGDEFAAAFGVRDEREARAIGERLLAEISGAARTVSIGIAVGEPEDAGQDLFACADRTLYEVKSSGGNGVKAAPLAPARGAAGLDVGLA